MPHVVIFHSDAFQEYAHVANEMPVSEFLEYSIFLWNSDIRVSGNTSSFRVYTLPGVTELISVEHIEYIVHYSYVIMPRKVQHDTSW